MIAFLDIVYTRAWIEVLEEYVQCVLETRTLQAHE